MLWDLVMLGQMSAENKIDVQTREHLSGAATWGLGGWVSLQRLKERKTSIQDGLIPLSLIWFPDSVQLHYTNMCIHSS